MQLHTTPGFSFRRRGFSLLEVLVVIAIVLVITSFSLPVLHRARVKSVVAKTKATMASLETALSMYESDFGDYPPGESLDSRVLVALLQGPVEGPFWRGPYMRFKREDLDGDRNVLDGWKTPLRYAYPQSAVTETPYTIVSAGPDRELGTGDDIGNW